MANNAPPSPPRSGGEGRGEEAFIAPARARYFEIKSPSPATLSQAREKKRGSFRMRLRDWSNDNFITYQMAADAARLTGSGARSGSTNSALAFQVMMRFR